MKIRNLFQDDTAVSPVIGVILMVAITVILAAVIGTFVLGLGDQVSETAPQASFSFDYDGSSTLTITHESGDAIDASRISLAGGGLDGKYWDDGSGATSGLVSAGASTTFVSGDGLSIGSGDKVRIIWTSESGSTSATLQSWTYNG
ncbi:type IV pilin [Haloferax sp. DFSO52]|uniref:type IV pilin n=1 Tax=Haloferax sp. DFSO52 TaxID=3388505 RepID=UPI003A86DA2C